MTRIVHLSDPHFGTVPEGRTEVLASYVRGLRPDLAILSGDLTQRARAGQFRAAAAFVAGLGVPVLCVPGNHDAPLWNLPLRVLDPWRGWRRHLGAGLEGRLVLGDVVVVGINSANPRVWKDGLVTEAQLADLERKFDGAGRRVLALHHPPEPPLGEPASLRGAARLVEVCGILGVEMVLSGHVHFTQVAPLMAARRVLAVQSGTCLSSRTRRDGNAFTVIDLVDGGAVVGHHRLAADGAFRADAVAEWQRGADGWH